MDIKKAKKEDLFLRTQLGQGKYGDEEVSISLAVNGSCLFVEFDKTNEKYIVNTQSIVKDVIEFRKEEECKTKEKNHLSLEQLNNDLEEITKSKED